MTPCGYFVVSGFGGEAECIWRFGVVVGEKRLTLGGGVHNLISLLNKKHMRKARCENFWGNAGEAMRKIKANGENRFVPFCTLRRAAFLHQRPLAFFSDLYKSNSAWETTISQTRPKRGNKSTHDFHTYQHFTCFFTSSNFSRCEKNLYKPLGI